MGTDTMASLQCIGLQKPLSNKLGELYTHLSEVPVFDEFDEAKLIDLLSSYEIDVLINCFANFKFTRLLHLYDCYNVHPSYLPYFRGRHPIHWALISGASYHGISIHKMTEYYDRGKIFWQEKVNISENMSVAETRELLMRSLEKNFPGVINSILSPSLGFSKKEIEYHKKDYWPRRFPGDSKLTEWNDPDLIYRKINALRSEDHPAYIALSENEHLKISVVKGVTCNSKNAPDMPVIEKIEDREVTIYFPNGIALQLTALNSFDEKSLLKYFRNEP
jgi:methionyl-tRNA formyltransferase